MMMLILLVFMAFHPADALHFGEMVPVRDVLASSHTAAADKLDQQLPVLPAGRAGSKIDRPELMPPHRRGVGSHPQFGSATYKQDIEAGEPLSAVEPRIGRERQAGSGLIEQRLMRNQRKSVDSSTRVPAGAGGLGLDDADVTQDDDTDVTEDDDDDDDERAMDEAGATRKDHQSSTMAKKSSSWEEEQAVTSKARQQAAHVASVSSGSTFGAGISRTLSTTVTYDHAAQLDGEALWTHTSTAKDSDVPLVSVSYYVLGLVLIIAFAVGGVATWFCVTFSRRGTDSPGDRFK